MVAASRLLAKAVLISVFSWIRLFAILLSVRFHIKFLGDSANNATGLLSVRMLKRVDVYLPENVCKNLSFLFCEFDHKKLKCLHADIQVELHCRGACRCITHLILNVG